ncbi:EAL domain-containing protein [Halomonas sp. ZH2S]|uniref:protein-glutamate O-methyltransferase n=1 Tax=Vreelandella zhuhanensis TaxID=2684210 RepID=A0A7X3GZ82_9GAMM|nr:EAL domain-containing protein [Halomonas zhuhanensis]MWJ26650.1 EAL domain-containing protein [Halomonas zhuhanensis]
MHSEHEHADEVLAVVGIWLSTDDLDSLSELICDLDPALPFAYVIQPWSPDAASLQWEELSRETSLKVRLLNEGDRPHPGTLLVAPANTGVTFHDGQLNLASGKSDVALPWINDFFLSLAADAGSLAVGVLLSDAGSGATAGLHAISAAGGIVLTKATTHDSGLVAAAIEADKAGFVLEPSAMARQLASLAHLIDLGVKDHGAVVTQLFEMLKAQCQFDFSNYKPSTVARRLHRRMVASGASNHEQYLALVESHPEELDLLARDILVSVTAFFRDPAAFEALSRHVPEIHQRCQQLGRAARIWVAGCATGEEAYSIAMLFDEVWGNTSDAPGIQIFATDIDEQALAVARRGFYSAETLKRLAPARLARYFLPGEGGYEVGKRLRDMVIFARHNLVSDPPFLRMDIIACRNVLIYFDANLQARVIKRFHFALHKKGVLLLGGSESVGQADSLFLPLNRRERLFRKRGETASVAQTAMPQLLPASPRLRADQEIQQLLDGVLSHLEATVALCDVEGGVLHTAGGAVDRFFHFPRGHTQVGIGEVIDVAFRAELLSMLHRMDKTPQTMLGRRRDFEGAVWRLSVHPVRGDELRWLVMIEPVKAEHSLDMPEPDAASAPPRPVAAGVEEELLAAREHLQALVEELATANEEMRTLHESVQSSNEEMLAANEELEAANEELQVSNEELVSLNEELNARSSTLQQLNEEYAHLYNALDFPILVFDAEYHLNRFNVAAARHLNLRATALQQHINRLKLPSSLINLEYHLARAMAHGEPEEAMIKAEEQVQQLAVTPGMSAQGEVTRLVVTLVDVTEISRTQSALEVSRSQLDTLMENTNILLAMKDLGGKYLFANSSFLEAFGLSKTAIKGRSDFELFPDAFAGDNWGCDLEALRGQKVVTAEHTLPGDPSRVFRTVHQMLRNADGLPYVIITEAEDITLRKQTEGQLRIAAKVFEHAGEAIVVTDSAACIQSVNNAFTRITGYSSEEALGRNLSQLLKSEETEQAFYEAMWTSLDSCGYWQGENWNKRKNGELYPEWLTINRIEGGDEEGSPSFVAVSADISSLKASQRQAEYLATHDALTGLPNRTLFHDRLDLAMAQARRHDEMVGLMFIDLDNFKSINDTLGHDVGDQLLVQAARRLRDNLRELDTVARLGGDEFTLILTDVTVDTAEHLAHRIVEMLARPFLVRDHSLFVSSSIGLAFFPDDGNDATALIKAADTAMYRAKENGRNRFELFKPELQLRLVQQARLASAMREGLRQDRFRLMFQPKYDTAEPPCMMGVEALLRWNDPELGNVSPAEFIPAAEATGLIQAIDRHVVQLMVQYVSGWLAQGLAVVPLAINISAYSFREESFLDFLFERLKRYGIPHGLIQVEITESTLVERTSTALGNIERLREAGILLSIDDFGTGYSSLSYLKRLPLAELKIDKSFVDGLGGHDRNDEAIAQAILSMASALGIRTVAEGVETWAQQAWLREHGCDYLQGFLLSRPLEADDFSRHLLKVRNFI